MKIRDKSVVEKVLIVKIKEKNINISLIRENTKVFIAALIVYIRVEQKFTNKKEKKTYTFPRKKY